MAAKKRSRKSLERDLARLRSERLAYIGTLASGLAHEIRTPLNAIKMNADLLAEELDAVAPEKRQEFAARLERLRRETQRLSKTLDAFLQFARPPRLEPRPVDLASYLSEILEFFAPEARRHGIELRREFQEGLYPVSIDPHQFAQVVLNLLTNAREAIGEQGEIVVRTREVGDSVLVEVEDNGGGVRPGDEERIFQLFYSTKEQGTGLGLGIARRIVEEHGGTLTLDNHPGKGARFIVSLPKVKILEYVESAIVPVPESPGGPLVRREGGLAR